MQLTYSETPEIGFPGLVAQPFSLRQIDSALAEGAIGLGTGVSVGTADGQYIPSVADGTVAGIAVYDGAKENIADAAFVYADKEQFPLLNKGRYYATANAALAIGAVLGYDPATGKVGAVVGATTTLAFGKAVTSAAADGDLLVVELDW